MLDCVMELSVNFDVNGNMLELGFQGKS